MRLSSRTKFILQNSLKALLSLAIIVLGYILFKVFIFEHNPEFWIEKFYAKPLIIYSIYMASEIFFGILPPELFMFWAINKGTVLSYFLNLFFFAFFSYGAAHLAFFTGRHLPKIIRNKALREKYINQYLPTVRKFGIPLIIIAAATPIPWAAISMIMGSAGFDYRKFSLYALTRFVRFGVYGYIIFHTHVF
jgi:hypothetical protein